MTRRIALVVHRFPPYALGGVEVYTHHLAQALKGGYQVSVFFRQDDPAGPSFAEEDGCAGGIGFRRVSCNQTGLRARSGVAGEFLGTFLNRQIEASFARFLDQFRPDLVHVQQVMALSARLLPLARRAGVPVLLTLHDYWFLCSNSQLIWPDAQVCRGKAWGMNCVRCLAAARLPGALAGALRPALAPLLCYRDWIVKQAALQADRFISPSQFLIDRYVAAGWPAGRFRYLENGIALEPLHQFPWRERGGEERLRIAYLGALAWHKGVHVLAEAFNPLPPGLARLRLWGAPTAFPAYADRLRQQLSHPDAEWMGPVANDQVGAVLADADVLVVPSLWYENSPVVIQEARAVRVPVIASGHGALAEKVRDGVDGLLFPPGDALALRRTLERLLDEPGLLPRLRRGIPAPMGIRDHSERLEAIYHEIWARHRTQEPVRGNSAGR